MNYTIYTSNSTFSSTGIFISGSDENILESLLNDPDKTVNTIIYDYDLSNKTIQNVNLSNSQFISPNFTNAQISGITPSDGSGVTLPSEYHIKGSLLLGHDVNLSNQNLHNIDISNINLSNANFTNTKTGNLSGHNNNTSLPSDYSIINNYIYGPNVDLNGANLSGADFTTIPSGPFNGSAPTLPSDYTYVVGSDGNWIIGPGSDLSDADLSNADLTDVTTGPLRSGTTPPSSLPSDITIYQGNDGDYLLGLLTKPFNLLKPKPSMKIKQNENQNIESLDIVVGINSTVVNTLVSNCLYINCIIGSNATKQNVRLLNCFEDSQSNKTVVYLADDDVLNQYTTYDQVNDLRTFNNQINNQIIIGHPEKSIKVNSDVDHVVFIGCTFTNDSKQILVSKKVALVDCSFS